MSAANDRAKPSWWQRLLQIPGNVMNAVAGMWADTAATWSSQDGFLTLKVDRNEVRRLKTDWRRILHSPGQVGQPSLPDRRLAEQIAEKTWKANRNNVTRTAAYLAVYQEHPELHWAFLAHMVSRNGGWNMTDLKGELLPRLLTKTSQHRLFGMLEDSNAFIFGDAYPQLLLYKESVQRGTPLFHFLPAFGVSAFMRPVWERFWKTRNSVLLTIALIVNEQYYIEQRIVQDPEIAENVIGSLPFQAQSALQLNQVMFPYGGRSGSAGGRQHIAGLVLENFGQLRERIEIGKKLYAVLFAIPEVAQGAARFAMATNHTGTRADYWPELFTPVRREPPSASYKERLEGAILKPGAALFYSPRLADAWKDKPLREPERFDWFRDVASAAAYFTDVRPPFPYEMSAEHCYGLKSSSPLLRRARCSKPCASCA